MDPELKDNRGGPRGGGAPPRKVAIVVVAYNAVNTLAQTLERIPDDVWELVEEVCVFDDASQDATQKVGLEYRRRHGVDKLQVYRNETNQGYGGNQKLAYRYAASKGYDIAVLLHGDGQYAPEVMMDLLQPLLSGEADAVMGSRMLESGGALRGGMPLYKYLGNRVLSGFENALLAQKLSEYHSGYRAYDLHTLERLPLDRNTDDFHFDTQIIVQLLASEARIVEVPIPTYYGDEICYVNGFKYAYDVARSLVAFKLHTLGLKHAPEYDLHSRPHYPPRTGPFEVIHRVVSRVPEGAVVLELGCRQGHLAAALARKGCVVDTVDPAPGPTARFVARRVVEAPLEGGWDEDLPGRGRREGYDFVILADQLEHLEAPLEVLARVRGVLGEGGKLLATTGNVAHWFIRLNLLMGSFHYTPRGILDSTHLRLYTEESFVQLLSDAGFDVLDRDVTVMPVEELHPALEGSRAVGWAQRVYYDLARRFSGLLAYQVLLEAEKRPDPLETILGEAGDIPSPTRWWRRSPRPTRYWKRRWRPSSQLEMSSLRPTHA